MIYKDLIETVSSIIENENIYKVGLTLTYELSEEDHNRMNSSISQKLNPYQPNVDETDEFEVVIGGILIKFKKTQK